MKIRTLASITTLLPSLFCPLAAMAQSNPLVGTWRHVVTDGQGNAVMTYVAQFDNDGHLNIGFPYQNVANNTITYYGRYRLIGEDQYETVMDDYEPKQSCGTGCYPVPQLMRLHVSTTCRFEHAVDFIMIIDCGNGPERFDRVGDDQ